MSAQVKGGGMASPLVETKLYVPRSSGAVWSPVRD